MPRDLSANFADQKDKASLTPINLYIFKLDPDDQATWRRFAEFDADVVFDSKTYYKSSIKRESIEIRADGAIQSTTVTVPDVTGNLWAYILQAYTNDTLKKARVEIRTIFYEYLSDSTAYISDEFELEDATRTWPSITFKLQNPILFDDIMPRSMWMKSRCRHVFKGSRCKYSGSDTTCERTLTDCQSKSNEANFGGVPTLKRAVL